MKLLETLFEKFLWNSRLMVLAAVLMSLVSAAAVLYLSSVDAWIMVSHLSDYMSSEISQEQRVELRAETIKHVVEIIDGYLLATVLLIFALGLYELFISKIDGAEEKESASKILIINSLDDLKNRLAKVILMILIVRYFEHALNMKFDTPLDLLYFAGGIALLGLALYLTHSHEADSK
ncbi:MAG: YqhA family protein [Aquificaceae bacterium]|nr:MAG: YqhA family protein [Aquificaceae bacterium]